MRRKKALVISSCLIVSQSKSATGHDISQSSQWTNIRLLQSLFFINARDSAEIVKSRGVRGFALEPFGLLYVCSLTNAGNQSHVPVSSRSHLMR